MKHIQLFLPAAVFAATIAAAPCGGPHAMKPTAIKVQGAYSEGGPTGTFTKIIDLHNGWSATTQVMGGNPVYYGFDGSPWQWRVGVVIRADAPPYVAMAQTNAFIDRLGWSGGARVPGVQVKLGSNGLAQKLTIDVDQGTRTLVLSDWRCVSGFEYPFTQTDTDATSGQLVFHVRNMQRVAVTPATFAPPPPQNHAVLNGAMPAEVPFEFTGPHDPHTVVNASIDGHPAKLIFDTGGANYFGPQSANSWGLKISGGENVSGPGSGSVVSGLAHVSTMNIGGAELRDQIAAVAPLPWPVGPNSPDGATGFQFLSQFRTTVDYQNRLLRFESLDSPPLTTEGVTVHFQTDLDGHMYVTALVNGVPGIFNFDTGDGGSITIFRPFAQRLGIGLDAVATSTGGGVGGSVAFFKAPLQSFSLAGVTLSNFHVRGTRSRTGFFASKGVAGNLGGGFLRCFMITIDYRARTITFTKQSQSAQCLANLAAG